MAATESSTLSELMLAAEYADQLAEIHRPRCRARGAMLPCKRCDELELAVFETDDALRHYFSQLQEGAA